MPAELRRGGAARPSATSSNGWSRSASRSRDDAGEFDATHRRARCASFQDGRGLRVDGIVGRRDLVGAGRERLRARRPAPLPPSTDAARRRRRRAPAPPERARLRRRPRGRDLRAPTPHRALIEFQRDAGLAADGDLRHDTIAALARVGLVRRGIRRRVREQEALLAGTQRLAGTAGLRRRRTRARGTRRAGRSAASSRPAPHAVLDTSGDDDSLRRHGGQRASRPTSSSRIRPGDEPGLPSAPTSRPGAFRSESRLRGRHRDPDRARHRAPDRPGRRAGKAYAVLRETRMPAVVCELAPDGDVAAMRAVVTAAGDVRPGARARCARRRSRNRRSTIRRRPIDLGLTAPGRSAGGGRVRRAASRS